MTMDHGPSIVGRVVTACDIGVVIATGTSRAGCNPARPFADAANADGQARRNGSVAQWLHLPTANLPRVFTP